MLGMSSRSVAGVCMSPITVVKTRYEVSLTALGLQGWYTEPLGYWVVTTSVNS